MLAAKVLRIAWQFRGTASREQHEDQRKRRRSRAAQITALEPSHFEYTTAFACDRISIRPMLAFASPLAETECMTGKLRIGILECVKD